MPDFPGGRGVGIQGLHLEDDRRRKDIQGAASRTAAGAGPMPGMRKGSDKGVTGDAPPNPARRS